MVTLPMLVNALTPHILSVHSGQGSFYEPDPSSYKQACPHSSEYRGIYLIDGSPATDNQLIYVGDSDSIRRLLINDALDQGCVLFSSGDSEHCATLLSTAQR